MTDRELLETLVSEVQTVNKRLDSMDSRLDSMDSRLDSMENRIESIEHDILVIKLDIENEIKPNIRFMMQCQEDNSKRFIGIEERLQKVIDDVAYSDVLQYLIKYYMDREKKSEL